MKLPILIKETPTFNKGLPILIKETPMGLETLSKLNPPQLFGEERVKLFLPLQLFCRRKSKNKKNMRDKPSIERPQTFVSNHQCKEHPPFFLKSIVILKNKGFFYKKEFCAKANLSALLNRFSIFTPYKINALT